MAHMATAAVKLYYDHDFPAAEQHALRAVQLHPESSLARWHYATCLPKARLPQGLTQMRRAVELDPASPGLNYATWMLASLRRKYDEAEDQLRKALELIG